MASNDRYMPLRRFPFSASVQEEMLKVLWEASEAHESMTPYLEYHQQRARRPQLNSSDEPTTRSCSDVVSIAKAILSGVPRDDILAQHQQIVSATKYLSTAADIEHDMDMCARLLTMTEVHHCESSARLCRIAAVPWTKGSLRDALACYFCSQKTLQADQTRLSKDFTAWNLRCIAGVDIRWTANLADHLRFVDADQAVFIFHCASFLQVHKNLNNNPFPESFIQETLDSIALLFPSHDNKTTRWLKSLTEVDPQLAKRECIERHKLGFGHFNYWHDRLVILKQVLDESSPSTLSQRWHDRRNCLRWYTFWIAIPLFVITVFFGVVQTVEAAVQIYLSCKRDESGT
ncbi:hypothetical protein CCMA1212_003162 [Trichoderma ghanense]|uniref:Uncharacterized protein n=1 Tax=Trichoderma ghanense TaxID=65468 RepID=A0ABY2H9B6_9HYPO